MNDENAPIYQLADLARSAQTQFQKDFTEVDPVVGIMRSLRDSGFAADAMTIDCIHSGKRIICILHDANLSNLDYQFGYRDQDPDMNFKKIATSDVSQYQFYQWMKQYFIDDKLS